MADVKFSELAGFTPKQKQAIKLIDEFKYFLYGGAMGGGKSYLLRWALLRLLLRWAAQGHRNVIVGLFCEDYPAMKDRHISKIAKEFPEEIGTLNMDHKEYGRAFVLTKKYGGGAIVFRNLDDPSKYASAEFAAIAVDEITKNKEEVFDDLRTRLRWPGIEDTRFMSATNPGGIGHAWVKKKFLDGVHGEFEQEADKFAYLQALATENPYLPASYIASLSGLPEEKRRAYLEGDWDMFKGQYFTEWRKEIHTCKPFEIPENWKRFMCFDYGYRAPSAVYWCAVDEDGTLWVYREIYKTELSAENLAQECLSMMSEEERELIKYIVADPAIWAKKDSPISTAQRFSDKWKEITERVPRLIKGINDRINGWSVMRDYLKPYSGDGELTAKLQVFTTCSELIRTIPTLIYDKHKMEDLDSDSDDHGADALRYGIMSRPPKAEKLVGIRSRGIIKQNNYDFFRQFSP